MSQEHINIGIFKIKELESSIIAKSDINEKLNVSFHALTHISKEESVFEIQVVFDIREEGKDEILAHIKVSNKFRIIDLDEYADKETNTYNIPNPALVTMLSLSISHTRALLARNTAGSPYEDFYFPLVNPTELAKSVFNIKEK